MSIHIQKNDDCVVLDMQVVAEQSFLKSYQSKLLDSVLVNFIDDECDYHFLIDAQVKKEKNDAMKIIAITMAVTFGIFILMLIIERISILIQLR